MTDRQEGEELEGALCDAWAKFAAKQKPLEPDIARILNEHLWELYER